MSSRQQANSRIFGAEHQAVAFPLGGIGTGTVSIGARGDLRDWEIFNKPAKGNNLPNTFFALRTQQGENSPVTRVLEGQILPPHTLSHGYHPASTAGLPRMATSRFRGEYPIATLELEDPRVPVSAQLEAFTPLLPLNPADSGLPCAVFTWTLTNHTQAPVALTLVGSLANPVGVIQRDVFSNIADNLKGKSANERREEVGLRGLFMHATDIEPTDLDFGSVALVTDHPNVTVKPAWYRGGWYDYLREFWDDLEADGKLTDLGYTEPPDNRRPDTGSLGLMDTLSAGESRSYRFILTWYFPNRVNGWDARSEKRIRNHYAKQFSDAWAVAQYVTRELPRLETVTKQFHDAFFNATLPNYVLDAVSANIVPIRSNTCFWLEDDRFYGWEGCFDDAGCCPGTCTHVWSYAQTLAWMFPSLEREMRRIEFTIETDPDGYMYFRNHRSFGEEFVWYWGNQRAEAAVDGQMGSVIRAYREWQLSGDKQWLKLVWPGVKSAVDFASMQWDADHDNVLDGRQHNTYDIEFYGQNPLSSVYYLAALRAVEELALVMEEPDTAARCHMAFEQGSATLETMLWNGEYYIQHLEDVNEHVYQHGLGCLADQLLGQLHAHIVGLGYLLPAEHVKSAVHAIFKHNYRSDFLDHVNCQRTYVLGDEAGLIICTWPNGGKPRFPFVYSDEVWTGIEYQVAAHLIYEGCTLEGLTIVKAVQDRHDGIRRNPWNEVECGHHYARAMSSWAVLLAATGFHADLGRGELHFAPVLDAGTNPDAFSTFWSAGKAWGTYTQTKDGNGAWQPKLAVLSGDLSGVTVHACGKQCQL